MSLEILEDEVKRKHLASGGIGSNASVHELAARELLYPTVKHTKENSDGSTEESENIDVDARTELPAPANTVVLEYYANFLDKAFGIGKGNGMRLVNERYKINMISKNRKGRTEFTLIAGASALNPQNQTDNEALLKKVQES